MVAAENEHIIGIELLDESQVLVDGVGGAGIPLAALALDIGRQNINAAMGQVQVPGRAAADVGIELEGLVLGQHTHHVHAAVGAVAQRKVDDPVFAAIGDGGLGHICREDAQTAALPSGEQHGHALLFVQHGNDPLLTFKRYRCAYISLSGE